MPSCFEVLPAVRHDGRGLTQINLIASILFGVLLLCLGVTGEYVGRGFEEMKNRQLFVVRDVLL